VVSPEPKTHSTLCCLRLFFCQCATRGTWTVTLLQCTPDHSWVALPRQASPWTRGMSKLPTELLCCLPQHHPPMTLSPGAASHSGANTMQITQDECYHFFFLLSLTCLCSASLLQRRYPPGCTHQHHFVCFIWVALPFCLACVSVIEK
jgi:hypothetical protein